MKTLALAILRLYQKTISFDHGLLKIFYPDGYCRFHPTCSQYSVECIQKHGLVRGGVLTFKRLSRCHPFSKGGFDPAP